MDKTKRYMDKQIEDLYAALSSFGLPVFEDEIAEDEEKQLAENYHCFVYETGDMQNNNDQRTLTQDLVIYYYSENLAELDAVTMDIIKALSGINQFKFTRTEKQRLQKKDTNRFIDRIVFNYKRGVPVGCNL